MSRADSRDQDPEDNRNSYRHPPCPPPQPTFILVQATSCFLGWQNPLVGVCQQQQAALRSSAKRKTTFLEKWGDPQNPPNQEKSQSK